MDAPHLAELCLQDSDDKEDETHDEKKKVSMLLLIQVMY